MRESCPRENFCHEVNNWPRGIRDQSLEIWQCFLMVLIDHTSFLFVENQTALARKENRIHLMDVETCSRISSVCTWMKVCRRPARADLWAEILANIVGRFLHSDFLLFDGIDLELGFLRAELFLVLRAEDVGKLKQVKKFLNIVW